VTVDRGRRLGPILAAGVSLVVMVGLIAVLRLAGLPTAANWAQLISIPMALTTLVQGLWPVLRRRPVTLDDVRQVRGQLALCLYREWRLEAQARGLDDPDPIPVAWCTDPGNDFIIKPLSSADVGALVETFQRLRRRRLEFPPFRRSGGYLLPVGAGVRLSGSVWACQAVSYSSGLR
jgi:hypothetical protein